MIRKLLYLMQKLQAKTTLMIMKCYLKFLHGIVLVRSQSVIYKYHKILTNISIPENDFVDDYHPQKLEKSLTQIIQEFPVLDKVALNVAPSSPNSRMDIIKLRESSQNSNSTKVDSIQDVVPQFIGEDYKNDGVTGEYDSLTYDHSRKMLNVRIKLTL